AYERCRALAAGEFLLLLVPGETLAPSALAKAVTLLDGSEDAPVVYADEDCIGAAGSHHTPFLRPDWSPDYLLSALYIDRAFFVRRAAVDAAGGFRADYDPVPEWDLLLRLSELGRPFAHVREVLFHRPVPRGSGRVDNASPEAEPAALLPELAVEPGTRVLSAPGRFNSSALVNRGAAAATGDVLCRLNSDVEATSSGWLEALLDAVEQP